MVVSRRVVTPDATPNGRAHCSRMRNRPESVEGLAAVMPVSMVQLVLVLVCGQVDGGVDAGVVLFEAPSPAAALVARTTEHEFVDELLDDGRHQRLGTKDKGPVHVWRPRGYKAQTAATIIYVHGFYTDVDRAMVEHNLTSQFRDSGRNALFIVPETRSGGRDPIYWPDLDVLLTTVTKRLKVELPKGPIIVVGHSGAYKTIASWLTHEQLAQVLLVDGLYGSDDDFGKWLAPAKDGEKALMPRQLVLVGYDTQTRVEWFSRKHGVALTFDTLPYLYDELPVAAKRAPLISLQSERFDHMGLITQGRLVPWLLHVFR
jgi:hypothetical protein